MKKIRTKNAIGTILAHDLTKIVPGKFKGRVFKKGHIITEEDIPEFLSIGKEHVYVLDHKPDDIHENDAAKEIAHSISGKNISFTEPYEGKVNLKASITGLLKVDRDALLKINTIEEVIVASRHTNIHVLEGQSVAGTRIIPLVTKKEKIKQVKLLCEMNTPIIDVKPYNSLKIGIVTTGNEIFSGRIDDKFGSVLKKKFEFYGSTIIEQIIVPDEIEKIKNAIDKLINKGADMIVATGGMSVDPDDLTPAGIKAAGGDIITYGAPVLPGAMFLMAYINNIPVLGLPGCVMYFRASIFDLLVPKILAGEKISRKDVVALGYGGFCLGCEKCVFPDCEFGK